MEYRETILTNLKTFYKSINSNNPPCSNCKKNNFITGQQCHLGTKYGEKTRVLVVALDCGSDGGKTIEKRTQEIEGLITYNTKFNPHMRGTCQCISNFFEIYDNPREAFYYFSMINACKCSRSDSMKQMPPKYFDNCSSLKFKEIEIIDPQVIFFQGLYSLAGCKFIDIENIKDSILCDYIKYLIINNKKYIAVKCIHPSAWGTKRNNFYTYILPDINQYIRDNLQTLLDNKS